MNKKNIYITGEYTDKNPNYHVEDSSFKWKNFKKVLSKSKVDYKSFKYISEIGCGAGQILSLAKKSDFFNTANFYGYDINLSAIKMAKELDNTIQFSNENFLEKEFKHKFDLLFVADVFEHIEDNFNFLKSLKIKSKYFLFNIPLEMNLLSLLRQNKIFDNSYKSVGHLHYYSKKTAQITLEHNGYKILSSDYAKNRIHHFTGDSLSLKKLLVIPQYLIDLINEDLSCVLFGGYSLVVLAIGET